MILFRNRLVFGLIKKIIGALFSAVYKIISLFNLQFTLLLIMVGVIMFLTGLFEQRLWLVLFYFAIILSLVYAIFATIKKLLGLDKRVKRKKNIQIIDDGEEIEEQEVIDSDTAYPKYFRVKNFSNRLMVEYEDRYELFEKQNDKWIKLRTDKK